MIKTAWQLKDRYHLSAADHRVHQVLREGVRRLTKELNKTVSEADFDWSTTGVI